MVNNVKVSALRTMALVLTKHCFFLSSLSTVNIIWHVKKRFRDHCNLTVCHNVMFVPGITLLQQEDEIMEATEGLSEAAKLLDQSVAIFAQLANSDRVSS